MAIDVLRLQRTRLRRVVCAWWVGEAPAGTMAGPAAADRVGAAVGTLWVLGGAALAGIGEGGGVTALGKPWWRGGG